MVSKDTEKKIEQLQLYEQNLQNLLSQRQQFQVQLIEVESALKELETTDSAYKLVGNIMVSSKKGDLKKELSSKKETMDLRVKTLEKQESQIKEKATKLREEVMEKMEEK